MYRLDLVAFAVDGAVSRTVSQLFFVVHVYSSRSSEWVDRDLVHVYSSRSSE